jgi:hypothetical protein
MEQDTQDSSPTIESKEMVLLATLGCNKVDAECGLIQMSHGLCFQEKS